MLLKQVYDCSNMMGFIKICLKSSLIFSEFTAPAYFTL